MGAKKVNAQRIADATRGGVAAASRRDDPVLLDFRDRRETEFLTRFANWLAKRPKMKPETAVERYLRERAQERARGETAARIALKNEPGYKKFLAAPEAEARSMNSVGFRAVDHSRGRDSGEGR